MIGMHLRSIQNPDAHPRPVSQDLAGFWDMLQLSIENISLKFDELHQLKANNWKPLTPLEIQVPLLNYRLIIIMIVIIWEWLMAANLHATSHCCVCLDQGR